MDAIFMNEMNCTKQVSKLRPKKKKLLCCPHPTKMWKLGRSVDFFFFFTYRERVEFSNICFKVSKWGKLGRNAVKTHIYTSVFLNHWIQILANSSPKSDIKKINKKNRPCFFAFYCRSGEGNITTTKKLALYRNDTGTIPNFLNFTVTALTSR